MEKSTFSTNRRILQKSSPEGRYTIGLLFHYFLLRLRRSEDKIPISCLRLKITLTIRIAAPTAAVTGTAVMIH